MILEQIYTDIAEEQRRIASFSPTEAAENRLTNGHGSSRAALPRNREWFISELSTPGLHPGSFSAVPPGLIAVDNPTQDYVLGYSQPSLRDSILKGELSLRH
jgi:hypothetical protein